MRLFEHLTLHNFRSYDHLELDFTQDRTLIIGENGAGKSSIVDALALVLTGQCRGVNAKGEGQRELVKSGSDEALVSLKLRGIDTPITLTIDRVKGATRNLPVDLLLGKLRTTPAFVQSVIYGRTFFGMHHADAKDLLMRLLDVHVSVDDGQGGTELIDLAEVELRYQTAFSNRAAANKALKALGAEPPALAVPAAIKGLARDQIQVAIAGHQTAYETAVNLSADVRAKVSGANTVRADLVKTIGKTTKSDLDAKRLAHVDMLTEHETQQAQAKQTLDALKAEPAEAIDTLGAEVKELKLVLTRVEDHAKGGPVGKGTKSAPTPTCVLGAGIPCLTPGAEFAAVVKQTKKQVADLEKRIKAGTARVEQLAKAQQSFDDATRNVTYSRTQIDTIDKAIVALADAQGRLAALDAELAELTPDAARGAQMVEAAKAALETAQATLAAFDGHAAQVQAAAAATTKRAELAADAKKWDALVDQLGPKGLRAKALQTALDDFQQTINAALRPFQFEVTIQVDPWQVVVQTPGAERLPFDLLSKGQQLWTGLAFQMALAAVSGLNAVVIDDVDGVVGRSLSTLTRLVMAVPVGQVLIVKAQADDQPAPDMDGLQVVRAGELERTPALRR